MSICGLITGLKRVIRQDVVPTKRNVKNTIRVHSALSAPEFHKADIK